MAWFIHEENIRRYQERLATERDPAVIATLRRLLEEEQQKLARYDAEHPERKPGPHN